jgi:hypothetical protein
MKPDKVNKYLNLFHEKFNNKFKYKPDTIINSSIKIPIECQTHGVFYQSPREHIRSKHGCPKCWAEYHSKLKTHSNEQYISECIKVHGNRYNYKNTKYTGSSNFIEVS